MKNTHKLRTGGIYLFESLSTAQSIFFKNRKEIELFKKLIKRYLDNYVHIEKIYIDSMGYQIVVKLKQRRTILENYKNVCLKNNKSPKERELKEPWRIISESMRVFKSIYSKTVNKLRGRSGALVKHSYKKYYFDSGEEYKNYVHEMEGGKEIESQKEEEFKKKREDTEVENWVWFRAAEWAGSAVRYRLSKFVTRKWINLTKHLHSHPN